MKIKNPNQETALQRLQFTFPTSKVMYRAGQVSMWSDKPLQGADMYSILSIASDNQLKPEFTRSGTTIRTSLK